MSAPPVGTVLLGMPTGRAAPHLAQQVRLDGPALAFSEPRQHIGQLHVVQVLDTHVDGVAQTAAEQEEGRSVLEPGNATRTGRAAATKNEQLTDRSALCLEV